jgi:hypothetical protein
METRTRRALLILAIVVSAFLPACGTNDTATPQFIVITATPPPTIITETPDPCASQNIEAEVQKIHNLMREFDDASALAASRPREQLADSIANLQRIRREAEVQPTPRCLTNLKTHQVAHMNTVINTLIAFMGGTDQQVVDQGIALARTQHDQYTIELARVLGLTLVPASSATPLIETPTP